MLLARTFTLSALVACSSGEQRQRPADSDTGSPSGDSADGGGTDGGSDTSAPGDSGGPTDDDPVLGQATQIAPGTGHAGPDLAIGGDGTLYVAWAHGAAVNVATSTDGGATWSTPVAVHDGSIEVYAHGISHPEVTVRGTKIVVSLAPVGHQFVYIGDTEHMTFDGPVSIAAHGLKFEDLFVRSAIGPDGDVWTSFHAFPDDGDWSDGWKGVARESRGWALEPASDNAPGVPCECCAHDLAFDAAGTPVLGYRNNIDNIRDITAAAGPDFDQVVAVGQTGWEINYCPVEGPRISTSTSGSMLMVWSDASLGDASVLAATRDGADGSWAPPITAVAAGGVDYGSPTVAFNGRDEVWMTVTSGFRGAAWAVHSSDAGATWSTPRALEATGGAQLVYAEVAAGAEQAGAVGVDDNGALWFMPLSASD